jgi:hypothetical protein
MNGMRAAIRRLGPAPPRIAGRDGPAPSVGPAEDERRRATGGGAERPERVQRHPTRTGGLGDRNSWWASHPAASPRSNTRQEGGGAKMLRYSLRYARYVLATLSTVAFKLATN